MHAAAPVQVPALPLTSAPPAATAVVELEEDEEEDEEIDIDDPYAAKEVRKQAAI